MFAWISTGYHCNPCEIMLYNTGQIVGSLHKEVAERKMAIERLKRDLDTEKREHLRNVIKVGGDAACRVHWLAKQPHAHISLCGARC